VLEITENDEDGHVYVIFNGKIIQREHTVEKPDHNNVLAVSMAGSILGVKSLDKGNSCLPTVWCQVGSEWCNLVKMTRKTFNLLWHEANTQSIEI